MSTDVQKFINPRFLKTIDLGLMQELLARHFEPAEIPVAFDGDAAEVRASLSRYFTSTVTRWKIGLVADLHRIAELGSNDGLQLILNEARRRGIELDLGQGPLGSDIPVSKLDPKCVALSCYLHHYSVFAAAADLQALHAPASMAEFRGPERGVGSDLADEAIAGFKDRLERLFADDLQGHYCRIEFYQAHDEIDIVVTHGAPVATMAVVNGDREDIITLQAAKYAVLRYAPAEGLLRIAGVPKAQQPFLADLFACHILARPGFFSGKDARDLYTLAPIEEAGPDFVFQHAYDEQISEVRIIAAAADLFEWDSEAQHWRYVRCWESKDPSGAALRHFRGSEVRFGRGWRLSELTFRVLIKTEGKRRAQVTVRLKPPGTLAFRRSRFEKIVHTLVARNGLEKDHHAEVAVAAAE